MRLVSLVVQLALVVTLSSSAWAEPENSCGANKSVEVGGWRIKSCKVSSEFSPGSPATMKAKKGDQLLVIEFESVPSGVDPVKALDKTAITDQAGTKIMSDVLDLIIPQLPSAPTEQASPRVFSRGSGATRTWGIVVAISATAKTIQIELPGVSERVRYQ